MGKINHVIRIVYTYRESIHFDLQCCLYIITVNTGILNVLMKVCVCVCVRVCVCVFV